MSSPVESRSNPTAWAAFWFALAGLVLMPIPLFIGLILGGALSIIAAILTVIGAVEDLARTVRLVEDLAIGETPGVLRIDPA